MQKMYLVQNIAIFRYNNNQIFENIKGTTLEKNDLFPDIVVRLTQPANIGPQDVPRTSPSNVPRTSPKDPI